MGIYDRHPDSAEALSGHLRTRPNCRGPCTSWPWKPSLRSPLALSSDSPSRRASKLCCGIRCSCCRPPPYAIMPRSSGPSPSPGSAPGATYSAPRRRCRRCHASASRRRAARSSGEPSMSACRARRRASASQRAKSRVVMTRSSNVTGRTQPNRPEKPPDLGFLCIINTLAPKTKNRGNMHAQNFDCARRSKGFAFPERPPWGDCRHDDGDPPGGRPASGGGTLQPPVTARAPR